MRQDSGAAPEETQPITRSIVHLLRPNGPAFDSRGAPAGEYVVNVHMYRGFNVPYPVPVKVVASVKRDAAGAAEQLVTTTVELRRENQELTALRFRLDRDGELVGGSVHSVFRALRARSPWGSGYVEWRMASGEWYMAARHSPFAIRRNTARQMIVPAVIFALLLGAFIFLLLPRLGPVRRIASVGFSVVLIAVVYGGGIEALGRPKPLRLEWRDAAEAEVLSALPVENEAIYLWLRLPGSPQPLAYALPWSIEGAQQLQAAMSEAEANGTVVQMAMPGESSLDDREPMFHAMPQPALPPKDYGGARPVIYRQPGQSS